MAVSSTTKDVCSDESSVPVNFRVTVCPANADRLAVRWVYPLALLRLEKVATVVVPTVTVSLSNWVVVVVSAESMWRKNDRV